MFEEMPASAFPEFLAAFWAEKGWSTSVQANDDGTYLVGGDKDNGTRGLIGVRPDGDTEIGASEVEDFAAFCDQKGVDVRVMATRGRFTTGARSAADAGDVHLLDPNELASSVREENAEHLVEEYADGGSGGGSLLDNVPTLPIPVPGGVTNGVPVVPIAVAAVVVAAAMFAGPTLVGAVPFVGGGGGGSAGPSFTAFSLAADANSTAVAEWDVRVQGEISTANNTYETNTSETFVVVQLNVTAGDTQTLVRGEQFALSVNGTNYAPQRFENASQSFRQSMAASPVSPGESSRLLVVFMVPAEFDGATLVERADGPGLRFDRTDLAFDVEA